MPNTTIEIGVIGAGWWAAQSHIPVLLRNPFVGQISVSRPDADNLAELCRQFSLANGFTDPAEMLASRPLRGVIISSPHTLHAEHAQLCIERNLPVLVEKPMATTAADARSLVSLAAEHHTEIMVPYGWNFKPFLKTAPALVRQGWIGDVRHVVCQMASPTDDLFAGRGLSQTKDHFFQPCASTWADPAQAGGFGWGQLSHALGLLFLFVNIAPKRVFAKTGKSPARVDWYDAAIVELENGATVSLSGSATVPKSCGNQLDIRIFGSEGMLLLDLERERLEVIRRDGQIFKEDIAPGDGIYSCEEPVNRFVDICRGEKVLNPADGILGLRSVEVLDAMYRSAETGRMEEI